MEYLDMDYLFEIEFKFEKLMHVDKYLRKLFLKTIKQNFAFEIKIELENEFGLLAGNYWNSAKIHFNEVEKATIHLEKVKNRVYKKFNI